MTLNKANQLKEAARQRMWAGAIHPGVEGWAKVLVEAEWSITEIWRDRFYDELVHSNPTYRKELEESIRWFGVRWS